MSARGGGDPDYPESSLVQKGLPCEQPDCGSSDAVALYDDGHMHCFSCGHHYPGAGTSQAPKPSKAQAPADLRPVLSQLGIPRAIKSRHLSKESTGLWDYTVRQAPNGDFEECAVYRDPKGVPVNVKIRGPEKTFQWAVPGGAHGNLYGRHKWGSGGRMLTILEGEIDTITVSQCNAHKYPVVGIPDGAQSAAKTIAKNLEWINTFDKVIFGFDMDEPGRLACEACAELLPPGKAYIVTWPDGAKDPSDLLQAGRGDAITRAIWQASPYRPDGIIDARDLTSRCLAAVEIGIPWPWPSMTEWTYGRRDEEVYVLGAGYGVGKTDWEAEVIACTITGKDKASKEFPPEAVAVFAYEAGAATTKKAIAGKIAGKRFHIPQDDSGVSWTQADLVNVMKDMDTTIWDRGGKLFINDSIGAADWEAVKSRARFLVHGEGVKHIFVDPISALVEEDVNGDERKFLDHMVRESSKLAVELKCKFYLLSHLTRPKDGPSHEEGGQVRGSQFRGSNAIGMFPNFVFGAERNTQAENEADRAILTIRVIKDRFTGNSVGKTTRLLYDSLAGTYDLPAPDFVGDI